MSILLEFPTVVFTMIAFVCTSYWILAVSGLFNIDFDEQGTDISGLKSIFGVLPLTFIGYFGLFNSLIIQGLLAQLLSGTLFLIISIISFLISSFIAILCASLMIKPLRKLTATHGIASINESEQQFAIVRSINDEKKVGSAIIKNSGIQVHFDYKEKINIGDEVLLIDYNSKSNRFIGIKKDY